MEPMCSRSYTFLTGFGTVLTTTEQFRTKLVGEAKRQNYPNETKDPCQFGGHNVNGTHFPVSCLGIMVSATKAWWLLDGN